MTVLCCALPCVALGWHQMVGRQQMLVYLGICVFLEQVCGGMEWWEGG